MFNNSLWILLFLVYSFQFLHSRLFLTQFSSLLFSRIVSKTGVDQKDLSREDEDEVENITLEFGSIENFPITNGSLVTRKVIFEFKTS